MDAGQKVFQNLLDGKVQYRVPLFQRTYSWGEPQWRQLWEDLLRVYAMDEPRNHFVGSVVTYPISGIAGDATKYAMIDGQQRMTTLLILLAVIRHQAQQEFPEKWPTLADEIWKTCLINEFAQDPEERIKLMPSRRDRKPFDALVNGAATPDTSQQVVKAWRYFDRAIRQGGANEDAIDLGKLKNCITNHLDIVSITLGSDDNPNRIFESLNYAGMSLGASDLIRNYLFMNIRNADEQNRAYDEHWYPMQEELGELLSGFFWRYLSMDGNLPRNDRDNIFNGVRQLIGHDSTDEQTVELTKEFHKFARYFAQLLTRDSSNLEKATVDQIRRLNRWEVNVARPFLMKALDYVNTDVISEDELVEVMLIIESFVIRRAVCNVPTNSLRSYFAQMSSGFDFGHFVESSTKYMMRWDWPSDDRFREGFIRYHLYVPARLTRTRLILTSLERSFNHKETPEITGQITIEHVMPQTLSDEWIETLGSNSVESHARWLHTVGNLTMTGYNSPLGNRSFADKKEILADSNFALTTSILESDEWNADTIQQRGCELAERALQIWPRPAPTS